MSIAVNMKESKTVYIGLGSNLGDRKKQLTTALTEIERVAKIVKKSSFYESNPLGYQDQEKFLNMAIEIVTDLNPIELIVLLQEIEHKMGRIREIENGPRTIDLDILLYDDEIINHPNLKIPHPRMNKREFVIKPLCEIAPEILHPVLKKSILQLDSQLKSTLEIKKLTE